MASETPSVAAKKSLRDGHVTIGVQLKCGGWGHDNARITASTELTSAQARALARSLIDLADKADEKVAAKAAAEGRRQKWRDRQIATGRMVVMNAGEFFNGRR